MDGKASVGQFVCSSVNQTELIRACQMSLLLTCLLAAKNYLAECNYLKNY